MKKFPRIMKVRQIKKDGSKYFGPYTSAYAVKQTIESIRNIFKIRNCSLKIVTGKENARPCLNYYIDRCKGPCIGKVDSAEYKTGIDEVLQLLNGREDKLIDILEERMVEASENLQFEHAAEYRDRIAAIRNLSDKQKITNTNLKDMDVIGLATGESDAIVQIFFIRGGKVIGKEDYLMTRNLEDDTSVLVSSFVKQYYSGTVYIPKEIYIETEIADLDLITKWLGEKRGNKVELKIPLKGEKSMLMKMVKKNAEEKLQKDIEKIKVRRKENQEALEELTELIGLDDIPFRVEGYDISNIQGVENVGSMVVLEESEFKKSSYRRFRIKEVMGQDDYGSMEEMLERRINRGLKERSLMEEKKGFGKLPDLILVDGGKGHVNIVEEVLRDHGLRIPVAGMVKDDKHATRGLIYENKEIMLLRNTKLYRLISSMQNEVHRFAISYHRNLRKKNTFKTVLDNIEGIGEKRKLELIKHFGSVEGVRKASLEDLKKAPLMNKKTAKNVFEYFNKEGDVK